MSNMTIFDGAKASGFFVEDQAFEGVKRIADRVIKDIELVTGVSAVRTAKPEELAAGGKCAVIAGTLGRSDILKRLANEGRWNPGTIEGKREVYWFGIVEKPFPEQPSIERALVIAGSDKRGTIYGLFHLSELCGVTALVYFGDVAPKKKDFVEIDLEEAYISKEPSVRYRGFFINDEWPAFGNWTLEQFGGVNAKAYDEIFIFLLRMKGNYMWPAMWRSVFSEDGPGLANAELADMYGVVMGLSHHEPMCRAGAEWQNIYSQYGEDNSWSFLSNADAITEFWKDGILRNKDFENVITIGMRGENDSKLMPENATLNDNIQVVKNAILAQHKLIREYLNEDLKQVPRMLAIYKEVEDYYYGDETCEGLKDWHELDDVIMMLSDDNFGNLRGIPVGDEMNHPGGYGMYYHYDYHGSPISFEWQNTNRLTKAWEQMTTAYEHNIRELWIVNVGDIKGVEYPLTYFMELAYDYDTWKECNIVDRYEKEWIAKSFGDRITKEQAQQMYEVMQGAAKWSALRRQEAMNENVYEPCHFLEADYVIGQVSGLMKLADTLRNSLDEECRNAFDSIFYYPAMATWNLILMNVEAGINAHLAKRGSMAANTYRDDIIKRIKLDAFYVSRYHQMLGGKWNHMMDSEHTGFRSWDANDWVYPTIKEVIPLPLPKIIVGFRDNDQYHLGYHWQDTVPYWNDDFTRPDVKEVLIDLDSRGDKDFSYEATCDKEWVEMTPCTGLVHATKEGRATIRVNVDRSKLKGRDYATIKINIIFEGGATTVGCLGLYAGMDPEQMNYPAGTFVETQRYIAMDAAHFTEKKDTAEGGFVVIKDLGRTGDAIKAYPVNRSWKEEEDAPWTAYDFAAAEEGEYTVALWLSPRNPRRLGGPIACGISVNDGAKMTIQTVSPEHKTEWTCDEWNREVMDNVNIVKEIINVKKGYNRLYFYAGDPGIVLEKIILCKNGTEIPSSYLGPWESWRI